jgi:DNA-binding transcriptional MerR regulator
MSEILAFTAENVCRLTGLSSHQLRYWDATDFFSPELLDEYRGRTFGRIYSFRDVVGLRTISVLRNQHRIPLQELRRVGEWLLSHHQTPWSALRLALSNRKVVFHDPQMNKYVEAKGEGQSIVEFGLEPVASEMRTAAARLKERREDQIGTVVRNRYVVRNAWVVGGTRIPTTAIWNFHQAGYNKREIVGEYPQLTDRDIDAAINFEVNRRKVA